MDKTRKRTFLGFIIAPLAGVVSIILLLIGESVIRDVLDIKSINVPSLANLIRMATTLGIPGMYLLGIVIGLPTMYILSKLHLKKWYSYLLSGLIWGIVFFGIDIFILRNVPDRLNTYIFFADEIISMVCFLCYWFIAVRED